MGKKIASAGLSLLSSEVFVKSLGKILIVVHILLIYAFSTVLPAFLF
ncbi:hypothetical protein [Piscirickettsia salmonis]|nr:hypothetical protein [Piscirickettsia salmonis]